MDLIIRVAGPADIDSCLAFDHLRDRELLLLEAERGRLILAFTNGRPVGYLRLEHLWHRVPYIGLLIVVPDLRGKGVGSALLAWLEDALRRQGQFALYSSSQADEPRAQAWHRSRGFVECGFLGGCNRGGVGEVFFRKELTY